MSTTELPKGDLNSATHPSVLLKWLVPLSAVFCAASIGRALWAEVGPVSHTPRIACESPHFDFGETEIGEVIEHGFMVSNQGGQDLVITNVSADCSCLSAVFSATRIPPGFVARVPVRISLDREDPKLERHLLIESNDQVMSKLALTITGRVTSRQESAIVR